jgi:MFS family permease
MTDAMKTNGVNVIAVLVIASFAIDRIVAALLFVVGFFGPRAQALSDVASVSEPTAARKRKLVYFLLAGTLCAVVLIALPNFRVLAGLGYPANSALDTFITALIVLGGSDRMSDLLGKLPGGSAPEVAPSAPKPIEVTGRLILEEPGKKS